MSTREAAAAIGLAFPDILLPSPSIDMRRWAVIACDQFTSEPGYWRELEAEIGSAPSTRSMIIPEADLERIDISAAVKEINATMDRYRSDGTLVTVERSMVLAERTLPSGVKRRGLVCAVDLEQYDFTPNSASMIRASEETIPSRLPTRMDIRRDASIESPHVLVLYDDPEQSVLGAVDSAESVLPRLYETELMQGGGSIRGLRIAEESDAAAAIIAALSALSTSDQYGFRYATGDGNHSLAAAKALWEEAKMAGADSIDPRRWCLVELVNVHDPGLPFHPIHRLAQANESSLLDDLLRRSDARFHGFPTDRIAQHIAVEGLSKSEIGFMGQQQAGVLSLPEGSELPVGVADEALAAVEAQDIDYVHGLEDVVAHSAATDGVALALPELDRSKLFSGIHASGALPRKAFSLGEARDKRYYLECRAIR